MSELQNKFNWQDDRATDDAYYISDTLNNYMDEFKELGAINGIGIWVYEDKTYTYVAHYFYDDTAKSDFRHSANLYRIEKDEQVSGLVTEKEIMEFMDNASIEELTIALNKAEEPNE